MSSSLPPLVDSHCHLGFEDLRSGCDAVIERARQAGVVRMVTVATTMKDFAAGRALAEAYDDVYCTVGVHPHEAAEPVTVAELVAASAHPKVVGIGECGLDFFYDHAPRAEQESSFRTQIRACIETGLPLIIHSREAEDDTIRILNEERAGHEDRLTGVLHCFSSKKYLADMAIGIGFYVSLSGILTFKRSTEIRDSVKDLPLDKLLVETDSPFLAPQSRRGKTCEPAFVEETARVLAEVKGVSFETMAEATTANFFRLFKKVKPL